MPPPLDLLDSVTAGHPNHPSPERPVPVPVDGPSDQQHRGTAPRAPTAAPFIRGREEQERGGGGGGGGGSYNNIAAPAAPPNANGYPDPQPAPPPYRPIPSTYHQQQQQQRRRHRLPHYHHHHLLRAFRHWLRLVYLDVLFMLLALSVTYVIMRTSLDVFRAQRRYFAMSWDPVSQRWYGPVGLSEPFQPFVLSVVVTGVVIPAVGVGVVLGMQVWVRSLEDVNAGVFGVLKGLVMMTFIQIFLKEWIGEFRPYFITVCRPVLSPPLMTDPYPFRRFATPSDCSHVYSRRTIRMAMQSFPSGHTSASFFVGTFLALYLNAKLKAFSDYHTSFWKWLAVMLPLFASCLVAGSLVVDRNHHVHDILLSIPWGILVAFLAYRGHYASIFDYRTNHLPLPWSGTSQSLRPTIPAPETVHGDNYAAVTWPRKPLEHDFDGRRENVSRVGFDGAADRVRGPRNISRGRLRQNIFPQPAPLMQDRTGAIVPDGQGDFELRDVVVVDRVEAEVGAEGSSTARASGPQGDLEGQRQRRWTSERGEDMG